MAEKIRIRCSKLPIAFKCPGSVRMPAAVPIDETNDPAYVGTAGHEGLTGLARAGQVDWDGVPALAKKHGVDEKELRVLLALGTQVWKRVRESFPNASAEVELTYDLGNVELSGHLDLLGTNGVTGYVGDWKLGRLDSSYAEQLRGYMALVLLKHPTLTDAKGYVLWVRDDEAESYAMDHAAKWEWLQRVENEIVQWDGTYRPGSHCQYCPRSHECPAANALARRDMLALMDKDLPGHLEDAETIRDLVRKDPDRAVQLLEIARAAEKRAARVAAALKSLVLTDGDVEGTEKRLTIQTSEVRGLEVLPTFGVLEELGFDNETLSQVVTLHISKIEEIVKERAGKGNGARALRELEAKLNEVGAIKTSTTKALVIRRQVA